MSNAMTYATPVARSSARSEDEADIARLGPWFHNVHLPSGAQTNPHSQFGDFPSFKWNAIAPSIPERLDGWRVLDIGCNAGFYTIELARRGAHVTGIDVDPHYLEQAAWTVERCGVSDRVELRQMQVYDLARTTESYDLIWFMGVFYHLRYPLLGLDIVAEKVRRMLVFQTLTMPAQYVDTQTHGLSMDDRAAFEGAGWPKMAFIEHAFADDPTNWWAANHAAVLALLRSAGMRVLENPAHEVYICAPDPHARAHKEWLKPELDAAVGR
jgi:tRNA (mo5U34)-methyltransferase